VKRLTPAGLTFGVMAIMGLLVAAYVVRSLMAREQKEPVVATRNMPTPVVDIPVGTEITEKHLGTAPIRNEELTSDMLANKNIIIGRVTREPLKKAVPIRANQLYAPGERPKLEVVKGKQALTLPFDSVTTIVDGLIRPGDHCDIRFTLNPSWVRSDLRTTQAFQMTLFKAIKVMAINRNVVQQQPEATMNTVTLEVTSKQANALLLARTYGILNLTYTEDLAPGGVNIADVPNDKLTLERLLDLPEKKETIPTRPPEPFRIDEYRALRKSVSHYSANGRLYDGNYNWNGWGAPGAGASPGGPPNGTIYATPSATGASINGPGNSQPGNSAPASNVSNPEAPGSAGPNKDKVASGNDMNGTNGSDNTAANMANPRDYAAPTQMAAPTSYANQPVYSSPTLDNNQAGAILQGLLAGQQANGPQFYGQSAPGQTTGPGYTVTPQVAPGIYGNVPLYRVPQ
jgi:pilus assembly protein CpaB